MVMSLQINSNLNNAQFRMVPNQSSNGTSNGSAFKVYDEQKKVSKKVVAGVFLTTLVSVGAATAIALKLKGKLTNPFKTPIKQWGLFSVKYEENDITWLVAGVGASSITGGLIGGAIFDKKENLKAKYREAVIQAIGNITTPLVCVAGGLKLFEKHLQPKILETLTKHNFTGKIAKGMPKAIAAAICLVTGIISGNKIGNLINKTVFKVDDERKLKLTDMSPHIDDVCLSLSIIAAESSKVISRIIPAALIISGFSTGIVQENPKRLYNNSIGKTNPMKEVKPNILS